MQNFLARVWPQLRTTNDDRSVRTQILRPRGAHAPHSNEALQSTRPVTRTISVETRA